MKYKGLTNYPVFLLTMISLIAISMLTLNILNQEYRLTLNNNDTDVYIEYTVMDNELYIHTNAEPPITAILLGNDTNKTIILDKISTNYYGPIPLSQNYTRIILLGNKNNEPVLLDILEKKQVIDKIEKKLDVILPPSISIELTSGEYDLVNQLPGTNTYYKLQPFTTVKYVYLTVNNTYMIHSNGSITDTGVRPKPYKLTGETHDNNLSKVVNEYSRTYGNISLEINITLYNYMETTYTMNTQVYMLLNDSINLPVIITKTIQLDKIVVDEPRILYIRIKHYTQSISLIDDKGKQYTPYTIIKEGIILVDDESNIIASNITTRDISSTISDSYIINGIFIVDRNITPIIYIKYYVSTQQPIQGNTYTASVFTIVESGYSEGVYAEKLIPDKLVVETINNTHVFYAVTNNTLIRLTIHSEQQYYTDIVVINDETITDVENITLYKLINTSIVYRVVIYPSIITYTTPNIELKTLDETSILYHLDNYTIGLYSTNDEIALKESVYPYINSTSIQLVIRSSEYPVDIIINNTCTVIIYGKNIYYTKTRIEIYNMLVMSETHYNTPMVYVIDEISAIINFTIIYIDNTTESLITNNTGIYQLGYNKIIRRINLHVELSRTNATIYYSYRTNTVIIVSSNHAELLSGDKRVVTEILGLKLYYVNTSSIIVYYK